MDITLRAMLPEEAAAIRALARQSFDGFERLFLPKPTNALVAMAGNEIVGGATYKTWVLANGQHVGYLETGFVKKGWEAKGIGSTVYKAVTDHLLASGCHSVTSLVRDDNVASWHSMEKCGYSLLSFFRLYQLYGFLGMLRVWFSSYLCLIPGYRLWGTAGTGCKSGRFFAYAGLNFLVFLPAFFFYGQKIFPILAALACLLFIPLVITRLISLLDTRAWFFDTTRGGILPSLLASCFGLSFPLVGHLYPEKYENTLAFRQSMGILALLHWATLFALTGFGMLFQHVHPFFHALALLGMLFLPYHSLPFDPFCCFGGRRIWDWNHLFALIIVGFSFLPALVYVL